MDVYVRMQYSNKVIDDAEVSSFSDPFSLFSQWFKEASSNANIVEANSMCLSTCSLDGKPSSRYVLMKSFCSQGLTFYSNYQSRKGIELRENPNACALFYWQDVHRQVRVEGTVIKISDEDSTEYFKRRPKVSQASASISLQSQTVASRDELEAKWKECLEQYEDGDIPKPSHWGGYLLVPHYFEFWQGQTTRLHDRICFKKVEDETWSASRLYP